MSFLARATHRLFVAQCLLPLLAALALAAGAAPRPLTAQAYVSPYGVNDNVAANTSGLAEPFTVSNYGDYGDYYIMSCGNTGPLTGCRIVGRTLWYVEAWGSVGITVTYNTGANGSGTLSLSASGDYSSAYGYYAITVGPPQVANVAITPDGAAVSVLTNATGLTYGFTVTNTGNINGTIALSIGACVAPAISCSVSPSSVNLDAGASAPATATYATNGTPGSGGQVKVHGVVGSNADDGYIAVTTTAPGGTPMQPVVARVNADSLVERDLCLTISAGAGAAFECGDLRLVHGIPGVRTTNKARAPTLIYNSLHAEPRPLVAAIVTLPSAGLPPVSVIGRLRVTTGGNTTIVDTAVWSGGEWQAGQTRRIVLGAGWSGAASLATGIYAYSVEVTNVYSGSALTAPLVTGKIAIVNRKLGPNGTGANPLGAGWWVAGVERLVPSTMVWSGGDGSVRQYVAAGTNIWKAIALDRPDSLTWNPATSQYTRWLPHGLKVLFDITGQHIATINRVGQRTNFYYDVANVGRLTGINVPGLSGTTFQFAYTATTVTITAPADLSQPAGHQTRQTVLTLTNGLVTKIQDPDWLYDAAHFTTFSYDGSSARVASRTDRTRLLTTTYGYDAGKKLRTITIPTQSGQPSSVTTITALESLGAPGNGTPSSVDTALVQAAIDGPRTDVPDLSRVWLDKYGQVTRTQDALGNTTRVYRTNASFPALVTVVLDPLAHVDSAEYDTRGNLIRSVSVSPYGGANAVSQYAWTGPYDLIASVTPPVGPVTTFGYDGAGNRTWQQTGTNVNRRVTFDYYLSGIANGLVRASQVPLVPRDSIRYDAVGNLWQTKSPKRYWTWHLTDNLGRDTLVVSPVAASDSSVALSIATRAHSRVKYDLLGRDTLSQSVGPAIAQVQPSGFTYTYAAPAESTTVRTTYDPAGRPLSVARFATPDTAQVGTVTTSWTYDLMGRKLTDVAADGATDSYAYDAAGNLTSTVSRLGDVVTMQYDTLNRLAKRLVPPRTYASWTSPISNTSFPYFSNGGSLTIPGDTATFTYDAAGRMRTAYNGAAQIDRTYFLGGALQTETQKIRRWDNTNYTQHVYVLQYGYDLAGRRTSLTHPAQLLPVDYSQSAQTYAYHDTTGQLATVTAISGQMHRYHYDLAGRQDSLISPVTSSLTVRNAFVYDEDGRRTNRVETRTIPTWPFGDTTLHSDAMTYDARGKILTANTFYERAANGYSGAGNLISSETITQPNGFGRTHDVYGVDALGNSATRMSDGYTGLAVRNDRLRQQYGHTATNAGTGRLVRSYFLDGGPGAGYDTTTYDAAGNRDRYVASTSSQFEVQTSYYGGDGRLRAVDRRVCDAQGLCALSPLGGWRAGAYEDYRYDALGRRVLARSRRDWCAGATRDCYSYIERKIWDGDQLLYEIRYDGRSTLAAGNDSLERDTTALLAPQARACTYIIGPLHCDPDPADTLASNAPYQGRVLYLHGLGIDAPLSVTRINFYSSNVCGSYCAFTFVPNANWRGQYDQGSGIPSGMVAWPATHVEPFLFDPDAQLNRPSWMGSLLQNSQDGSGQQYMRNRYYDPASGRFTQEDPIGLAGGLNAYGFAAGDPVNYSDPFGLKPCPPDNDCANDQSPPQQGGQGQQFDKLQPFGVPMLGLYEKRSEIHYGGMAMNTDSPGSPEANYKWQIGLADKPGVTATLRLSLQRKKPASFGRTEYIYSGVLEVGDKVYEARANLFRVGSKIFYGYIDANTRERPQD